MLIEPRCSLAAWHIHHDLLFGPRVNVDNLISVNITDINTVNVGPQITVVNEIDGSAEGTEAGQFVDMSMPENDAIIAGEADNTGPVGDPASSSSFGADSSVGGMIDVMA